MSDEEKQKAADAAKNGYGWMPGEQYIQDQFKDNPQLAEASKLINSNQ